MKVERTSALHLAKFVAIANTKAQYSQYSQGILTEGDGSVQSVQSGNTNWRGRLSIVREY
jgi:hypothetical protein